MFFFFLVFILWSRGQDGEERALHGPEVTGALLENSLPKEGVLAPYLLLLKMIFSLHVTLFLSLLIPGVSCFCRDKGVN